MPSRKSEKMERAASEDPNKRKIITSLKLAEVSLVEEGGHQDAHVAIVRTKPSDEEPMNNISTFLRTAIAAIAVPLSTPIQRSAMDFKAALQAERADELMEAMFRSFYSIMWSDESVDAKASMLKDSASQFADAVASEMGTAENAGTEMARRVPAKVQKLNEIIAAADAKDQASLERLIPKQEPVVDSTPAPAMPAVPTSASDGDLVAALQRAAPAATGETAELLRKAAEQIKIQEEASKVLLRQKLEAQRANEDAEIVRTYGQRTAVKGSIGDADLCALIRASRESGTLPTVEKLLARIDALATVATSQASTAPTAPTAVNRSKDAILAEVQTKAEELMRTKPSLYPNQAAARAEIWRNNPAMREEYDSAPASA